ncbi:hypothetical protein Tco_0984987, partial [Tanacetum coccineum]
MPIVLRYAIIGKNHVVYTLLEDDRRRCPQQGDYQSGSREGNSELVHGQVSRQKWGKIRPLFSPSLASISEGLIPSAFLPLLLPSLFGASSNPTTLSRCLRGPGDLSRRVRVASLQGSGLGSISRSSLESSLKYSSSVRRTNRRVRISQSGSMICKWHVFRSGGGKHGSSYMRSFTSGVV